MPPPQPDPPPRPLWRVLLCGCVVGLVLALALQAGDVLVGPNLHTVVPGVLYRCSQPSAHGLERLVQRFGIRTVVNLRGCCDPAEWYLEQCRVTNRLNISQEDLGFSAGRLPSVAMLRHLLDVLDHGQRPLLIHCHKGADRTGMTCALFLLLHTDSTVADARRQLGPRTGHLPLGRTVHMDRLFDLYEEWLAEQGCSHSPDTLRQWVHRHYCAGAGRASLEVLAPTSRPLRLPRDRPSTMRVRCTNTAVKPWRLQPGSNAGIHLKGLVFDDQEHYTGRDARAGMFFATVPPGEHIDLTLALPALSPGRYVLRLDMMDEQQGSFLQLGGKPLFCDLEVP